jgi:ATP-dependent protease HslVU (ClpYQ) peptidase subunit
MTCIIAYKNKKGNVVLAGDKMGSNGYTHSTVKEPKVFKKGNSGEFMFGWSGSFRMAQILNHLWVAPKRKVDQGHTDYIYSDVIPSFIKTFDDNRFGKDNVYGFFIMVFEGHIYEVQENMSILERERNTVSVGSGQDYAVAAVDVLLNYEEVDKTILKKAYEVVNGNVDGVTKEFDFITDKKEKECK